VKQKTKKIARPTKTAPKKPIEREYRQTFTPLPLPYHGVYTDEDSLEQPSELEDIPTTSIPFAEA
jgi:hypothetical protein